MKTIVPMEVFKALSNEARLQILEWLKDPQTHFSEGCVEAGVCVSQITDKLQLTQSTTSQYLSLLQRSGLITATRVGKWTYYKRNESMIEQLATFIQMKL